MCFKRFKYGYLATTRRGSRPLPPSSRLTTFIDRIDQLFSFSVDHSEYFHNGRFADFYRNNITVEFTGFNPNDRHTAGYNDVTVNPVLTYRNSLLYPSRRLLINGIVQSCDWLTSVSGNDVTTHCEAVIGFRDGGADVIVRAEAYLPPTLVIKSVEITVAFQQGS